MDTDVTKLIEDVIRPGAARLDTRAQFARSNVNALGRAGLLGLTVPAEYGGEGKGLRTAASVVERIATSCASTATVLQAHYCAVAVLSAHAPAPVLKEIAAGKHLSSLALGELDADGDVVGPEPLAPRAYGNVVDLYGRKARVTAAGEADSYVWSSAYCAEGSVSLWLVPANAPGLHVPVGCDPAGLRGASLAPITAEPAQVPDDMLLGEHAEGRPMAEQLILPWFGVLSVAVSLGIMEGTIADFHGSEELACRAADLAWMRACADATRGMFDDSVDSLTMCRATSGSSLPAVRSNANEAVREVTEFAARVCSGADPGVRAATERRRRDAQTAQVIDPTPAAHFGSPERAPLLTGPPSRTGHMPTSRERLPA